MKRRKEILLFLFTLIVSVFLPMNSMVSQAEDNVPKEEEYPTQYALAVDLADMLRVDPYMIYNKTYTVEQEIELKELVHSICQNAQNDRERAEAVLAHIRGYMEIGPTHDLGTWDMLCDGESLQEDGENKKKSGRADNFCFAFYDLCRMQNIPCFMVEDCRASYTGNYICMVYLETEVCADGTSGETKKDWYFVDVADTDGKLVTKEQAYSVMGSDFFPLNLSLDYDENCAVNEIHLSRESMRLYSDCLPKGKPMLVYDQETNSVKTYMTGSVLADGENYYSTTTKVGENGEAPSGWMEMVAYQTNMDNERDKVTYISYAVHGVFLRGRVSDGELEYDLQAAWNSIFPFYCEIGQEPESEEHKQQDSDCQKALQTQAIRIAEALVQDDTFLFDMNFTEEEEAFLRNALNEALSWEYIQSKKDYFELYGITLGEEGEPLSDRVKAQAICFYIRDHVQYGGAWYVNSYTVLKSGYAICGGYSLLFRDLCVMADIPCFCLMCSTNGENVEGRVFSDHGNNLLKVDGEWIFADPTSAPRIGTCAWYPTAFLFGYNTFRQQAIYIDFDYLRKEYYGKWSGAYLQCEFYEFDSEGQLGVYSRDRKGNPVQKEGGISKTDENGKMSIKNGLYTLDAAGDTENGEKVEEWRYVYYVQQGKMVQGRNTIQGTKYNFDTTVYADGYTYYCQKVQKLSEKYYIQKLDIGAVDNQIYSGKEICPVPVITHGEKTLEPGKDFIISYEGNKEITREAETRFKVEGIGDYTGSATRTFKIIKRDLSNMEVTLSQTSYTWNPQGEQRFGFCPEVMVELDPLDYEVDYYDYTKVGKAKAVITGKNHCTGSITKYYDIKPCIMDAKSFRIEGKYGSALKDSYEYNFKSVTPEIAVNWYLEDGTCYRSLSQIDECRVTYSNTEEVGTATITVEGTGKFRGTLSCTYDITPYDIRNNTGLKDSIKWNCSNEFDIPRTYYTGEPVIPDLPGITYVTEYTPKLDGLERDVHYTINATNNIHVGMGTLTIQGIGCCTGTMERTFKILPKTIDKENIQIAYRETAYNGKVQKPAVTIEGLTEGKEYNVTYEKKLDGEYKEVEPKETGDYYIAVQLLNDDVEYSFGMPDSNETKCYRLEFSILEEGQIPTTPSPTVSTISPGTNPGEGGTSSGDTGAGSGGENFSGVKGEDNTENSTQDNSDAKIEEDSADDTTTDVAKDEIEQESVPEMITTSTAYKVKKLRITAKKKTLIIRWSKVKQAKSYQLQVSLRKDFKKAKKIMLVKSKTSYQTMNLKKKTKYYVRVRAYKGTVGKGDNQKEVYGAWCVTSKTTK